MCGSFLFFSLLLDVKDGKLVCLWQSMIAQDTATTYTVYSIQKVDVSESWLTGLFSMRIPNAMQTVHWIRNNSHIREVHWNWKWKEKPVWWRWCILHIHLTFGFWWPKFCKFLCVYLFIASLILTNKFQALYKIAIQMKLFQNLCQFAIRRFHVFNNKFKCKKEVN